MQVFAVLELRANASKEELNRLIEEEELYLWQEVVSDRGGSVWSQRDSVRRDRSTGSQRSDEARANISAMPAVRSGVDRFHARTCWAIPGLGSAVQVGAEDMKTSSTGTSHIVLVTGASRGIGA
jgi:hypothetical protein